MISPTFSAETEQKITELAHLFAVRAADTLDRVLEAEEQSACLKKFAAEYRR